jgi:GTP cyclohydrolase II
MNHNKTDNEVTFGILATTKLPIVTGRLVDAVVFGTDPDDPDVIALVHKNPDVKTDKALVRLHSACITSEVLGSTKCDCAEQLDTAISLVSDSDWGIVVYLLKHEGRGIGLVNKIRAYSLQHEGLDTVDANLELGFGADDRDFNPAVKALRLLGVNQVELLTNNPEKVAALRSSGFDVFRRTAMDVPITDFNRDYLVKKQEYFGHQLLRCPSTQLLTVEAALNILELETDKPDSYTSAFVVHVESEHAGPCLKLKNEELVRIATIIKGLSPFETSLIARMAGDRILILLRDTDIDLAEKMAEKLHAATQESIAKSDEGNWGEPLKASIGVADSSAGEDLSKVILAATVAVERALANGGCQVAVDLESRLCTA